LNIGNTVTNKKAYISYVLLRGTVHESPQVPYSDFKISSVVATDSVVSGFLGPGSIRKIFIGSGSKYGFDLFDKKISIFLQIFFKMVRFVLDYIHISSGNL
jgi:hypothetical protein